MKVLRPIAINDDRLTSTTVPEDDYAEWAGGTTYAAGDYCIVIATHRIYRSLQASNTNHAPASSPTWWADVGPTNAWAMFDTSTSSQTTVATSITVVLTPGQFDSLSFINMDCAQVQATLTVGGVTKWTQTVAMVDDTPIADWRDYFAQPILRKSELVLSGIPLYASGVLTVVISATAGDVSCGGLVPGISTSLGGTLAGPALGMVDYNRITTDDYGVRTVSERGYAKRNAIRLYIESNKVDAVYKTLVSLRGQACVWVGSEQNLYDGLVIFGYFKDFSVEIPDRVISFCSIEIEGIV